MATYKAVTRKGLALITKTQTSKKMKFTNMRIGNGIYDTVKEPQILVTELEKRTELIKSKQTIPITSVVIIDDCTVRARAVLSNEHLTESYLCTEVGVFAEDPDEGEILYCIAIYDEPNLVRKATNAIEIEEILFSVFTNVGNTDNLTITISQSTAYASAADLEELIFKFKKHLEMHYIDRIIFHNLNTYPDVLVIEFDYGYGMGGYGIAPYGGSTGKKLRSTVEYFDRNRIQMAFEKKYNPVKNITQIYSQEHIVTFNDSTLSLCVSLFTNHNVTQDDNNVESVVCKCTDVGYGN